MIVDDQELKLLKTNSLFKGVSYSSLKPHLKPKNFFQVSEGEIIYKSDDEATDIYLIVEGEVKIKFCEDKIVKSKFILDFFGETEVLSNSNRISHAVANISCILYKIPRTEFKNLISTFPIISNNIGMNGSNKVDGKVNQPGVEVNEIIKFSENETEIISFDEPGADKEMVELTDNELNDLMKNTNEKSTIKKAFEGLNKDTQKIDGDDEEFEIEDL